LWLPDGKTGSWRHVQRRIRTVKLEDRQVRILPKYRRRRQQLAVDWTSQMSSSSVHFNDETKTALNGSVVQAPITIAGRWKDTAKTVDSAGGVHPAHLSTQVHVRHHEVNSSAETCRSQPVTSTSNDKDLSEDEDDGPTALDLSDNDDDYDADIDEELNASSRSMLSRIIVSKLQAALPGKANRELSRVDEDRHNDDEEDVTVHHRTKCEHVASCCSSFISFLASTVGLTCLLVVYTLLGGVLFVGLEAEHERLVKSAVTTTRDEYVHQLWTITQQLNVLHPDNWSTLAERLLERYADEVYVATKTRGWDGRQDFDNGDQQWSFAGGLLYSITVMTTIGTSAADLLMPTYSSTSHHLAILLHGVVSNDRVGILTTPTLSVGVGRMFESVCLLCPWHCTAEQRANLPA